MCIERTSVSRGMTMGRVITNRLLDRDAATHLGMPEELHAEQ